MTACQIGDVTQLLATPTSVNPDNMDAPIIRSTFLDAGQDAGNQGPYKALTGATNVIDGKLIESSFRGGYTRIVAQAHDTQLVFELDSAGGTATAESALRLSLRPEGILCLPTVVRGFDN